MKYENWKKINFKSNNEKYFKSISSGQEIIVSFAVKQLLFYSRKTDKFGKIHLFQEDICVGIRAVPSE